MKQQIYRNPPTDTQFHNREKKLDRPSADQHLSMLCFYGNIMASITLTL